MKDKDVLVIGAGRVGTVATDILIDEGAKVTIFDIMDQKTRALSERCPSAIYSLDNRSAIMKAPAIMNTSPGAIPGEWIMEGAVISSPGLPYAYDGEGERCAAVIIHDPSLYQCPSWPFGALPTLEYRVRSSPNEILSTS